MLFSRKLRFSHAKILLDLQDNQSEISHTESHASHRVNATRSGSRVSGQSSLSKLRRGSASSLPASLVNMGAEVSPTLSFLGYIHGYYKVRSCRLMYAM